MSGIVLLAGCAGVGPDYQRPAIETPQTWSAPADGQTAAASERWWTLFNDAALNTLVEEALANNSNLQVAAARVDEARALLGVTDADRYPAVFGDVSRSRTRISEVSGTPFPPGTPLINNNNRLTLSASYELDLWGSYRRASDAARADLLATEAARDTVQISLIAQVAQSYFALAALDAQVATTRRTLEARREWLGLQQKRFDAGVISAFDLRQLEAEVAAAEAQLPSLIRQRAQQENALAVLLGHSPKALVERTVGTMGTLGGGAPDGSVPRGRVATPDAVIVPSGLPADLLLRRPDLIEAEQRLIAANARIGVARAAYFPAISLTGYLGAESASLGDLFSGPARIWQFVAALTQPIFQGGRVGYQVDAATARERQAVEQYQEAVVSAFRDVQDALIAQTAARETLVAEERRRAALAETLNLARLRYDNGVSSQLDVLDAERNLLSAELNRIEAERAQRSAIADLFRALGGGWDGASQH